MNACCHRTVIERCPTCPHGSKVRLRISSHGASATYFRENQSELALRAVLAVKPPEGMRGRAPRHWFSELGDIYGPTACHVVRWEPAT